MPGGLIAAALRRAGILEDVARNARGVGDAALSVGKGLLAQIKSGVDASVALADRTQADPLGYAADVANRSMEQSADFVAPRTVEGGEQLQRVGGLLSRAASTAPGRAIGGAYDAAAIKAPALMALGAGVANVASPGKVAPRAPAILNIGHKVGDVVQLTPERIEKALAKRGVKAKTHQVRESNTEPTSVIETDRPLTPEEAHALSVELQQDAIAQRVGDAGELHGPRAQEWGPFNPDYFLQPEPDVFTHANLLENPGRQRDIKRYQPRKTPAYAARLESNEDAFAQLKQWAEEGMNEEGLGWYNTEEMRKAFVNELGPDEGQRAYEMYIDLVAATSAGAKTPANAKIAGHYYYNAMRGQGAPMPAKGSGYGHKAQNLHNSSAKEIVEGRGGLLEIKNPKRFTFAENLKGNWDHVTVDKHNVRALGMASRDPEFLATALEDVKAAKEGRVLAPSWWNDKKHGQWNPKKFNPRNWYAKYGDSVKWEDLPATWFRGTPSKTDYASLERVTKRLAKELNTTPAQAQAALWLGAGSRTGLGSPPQAFMKVFADRIKATAKRDGITQEQALKDFIRAKRMLGHADPNLLRGAAAGGGLVGLLGIAAGNTGGGRE